MQTTNFKLHTKDCRLQTAVVVSFWVVLGVILGFVWASWRFILGVLERLWTVLGVVDGQGCHWPNLGGSLDRFLALS